MAPNRGIPDMAHINRKLPIADIARALDLRFASATMLHCWRPERHQHGDRTASASILTSSNKIKCFVCNFRPKGPIDFAMDVLEMSSPADAALWIAARFPVPLIPARKHLAGTARRGERVQSGLALMIRSGLWAQLSPAAKAIAPALLEMAEKESGASERMTVELSYVGITRMSGITSPNAIHRALCCIRRNRLDVAAGRADAWQAGPGDGSLYDDAIFTGVAGYGPSDSPAGARRNRGRRGVAGAPPKGARAHVCREAARQGATTVAVAEQPPGPVIT
jgi:hypothetical protein